MAHHRISLPRDTGRMAIDLGLRILVFLDGQHRIAYPAGEDSFMHREFDYYARFGLGSPFAPFTIPHYYILHSVCHCCTQQHYYHSKLFNSFQYYTLQFEHSISEFYRAI